MRRPLILSMEKGQGSLGMAHAYAPLLWLSLSQAPSVRSRAGPWRRLALALGIAGRLAGETACEGND